MGLHKFFKNTRRFASVPRSPCLYAAELIHPEGVMLKIGVGGNAMGRMMSLRSEAKRNHGASLGRFAIYTTKTLKSAFEAETRAVRVLSLIHRPVDGRREFFAGLSFDVVCEVVSSVTVGQAVCTYMDDDAANANQLKQAA